jgi:hypothetical protein
VRWLAPRPGRFTPGKDPVPIVQDAGWAPRPVWTNAVNLVPIGIRSPDCSDGSEELYRLRYPGPCVAEGGGGGGGGEIKKLSYTVTKGPRLTMGLWCEPFRKFVCRLVAELDWKAYCSNKIVLRLPWNKLTSKSVHFLTFSWVGKVR